MRIKSLMATVLALVTLIPAHPAKANSPSPWDLSYSELARASLSPALQSLESFIRALHSESLPHETKDLRKKIVQLRDYLDLFSYSFYFESPYRKQQDPWNFIRYGLDEGYRVVGEFKDLFDTQGLPPDFPLEKVRYKDHDLLKKRRKNILQWRDLFYSQLVPVLSNPYILGGEGAYFPRPDGVLSKFYWSKETLRPHPGYSGLENVGRLAQALLHVAAYEEGHVLELGNVLSPENEEIFHDFRKRVRVVIKITEYFPDLLSADVETQAVHGRLKELVSRYGQLNDRITAYRLAEAGKKKGEAERLREWIQGEWKALRIWQRQQDFRTLFGRFFGKIRVAR